MLTELMNLKKKPDGIDLSQEFAVSCSEIVLIYVVNLQQTFQYKQSQQVFKQ